MKKSVTSILICSILILAFSVVSCFSVAEAKKMQTAQQAQKAALKKVPSAKVIEVESDTEDGVLVYEVELYKSGKEYKLEYRALDGKLMKYEWEILNPSSGNQNKKNLSKQAIKKKALKQVSNATVLSIALEHDDGMVQYEVKMHKGNKKYELVYNGKTGKLLEYQWKIVTVY
jgi:uncharacterized membrane protein YkoI